MKITVGGSGRLHSGGKISQQIQDFNRANHNLSKKVRMTVAPGVVDVCYRKRVKPGDTFDISDINIALYTDPTLRAMYGSYTAYVEFFYSPTRLKQAWLHNNKEYIGEDMSQVKLPIMDVLFNGIRWDITESPDLQQIHPSSLLAKMGLRSAGQSIDGYTNGSEDWSEDNSVRLIKNCEKVIDYYDIVKNYYSNRQEKFFYIIDHAGAGTITNDAGLYWSQASGSTSEFNNLRLRWGSMNDKGVIQQLTIPVATSNSAKASFKLTGVKMGTPNQMNESQISIVYQSDVTSGEFTSISLDRLGMRMRSYKTDPDTGRCTEVLYDTYDYTSVDDSQARYASYQAVLNGMFITDVGGTKASEDEEAGTARLTRVPITNVDDMREDILARVKETDAFVVNENTYAPYGSLYARTTKKVVLDDGQDTEVTEHCTNSYYPLQGLALCTYKSDKLNNWLDSTYINKVFGAGGQGIVDVTAGLNLNTLLLAQKIFNQANKTAIGNRSYTDWLLTIHGQRTQRPCEIPTYEGGISQDIYFEELKSTAETGDKLVGSIVANATMGGKKHGGNIVIRCEEAGLIYGIVRIVPNIIYSQGNDPDDDILTMDDIHQPDLDGIGYQDLLMERLSGVDVRRGFDGTVQHKSIGKQPAHIDYMTDIDESFGDFAIENNKMEMTLNRRYSYEVDGGGKTGSVVDATTYIDPSKYNYVWAGVSRKDQHFDLSISFNIEARRKVSTRQMPNF